jgi:ribonuclease G
VSSELLVSRLGGRTCTALREDGVVVELRVEDQGEGLPAGRIVKARVSKILPGIQSAFLAVGGDRDAFLHAADLLVPGESRPIPPPEPDPSLDDDVLPDTDDDAIVLRRPRRNAVAAAPIEARLKEGRDLIVQVTREALGGKGPRVTCFVTLPGRYLVYSPMEAFRGVSRRIVDPEERQRLRDVLAALPSGAGGFIVRTAGEGAPAPAFEADAAFLVRTWQAIQSRADATPAPALLHADLDLFLRSLRDASAERIARIVVDDPEMHRAARDYLGKLDPVLASRLKLHAGSQSLFDASGVTQEVDKALRPRVWLKSGGTIVIQPTEALVSIDVNTGKYVGSKRPEETVLKTNLEAADEIARQLRLRDLGGIIVIDFIDMDRPEHQRQVIEALEGALAKDRSRTKIVGLSELGLLQLTRKRTRPGFGSALTRGCPICAGVGRLKSPETVAYEALVEVRRLAGEIGEGAITVHAAPEVSHALRLAVQTAGPVVDASVIARLRVEDDPAARPDMFDITVL